MVTKNEVKVVRTFKELQEVDGVVGDLYKRFPALKETKFGYAYKRFSEKSFFPAARDFNDELTALRVEHALEDEKTKEVLIDRLNPRGFKFSKAELIKLMAEEKKLQDKWDKKEITIIPYLSPTIPTELTESEREILTGIVL